MLQAAWALLEEFEDCSPVPLFLGHSAPSANSHSRPHRISHMVYRVLKHAKSQTSARAIQLACPGGVLGGIDVTLGMRHQTKDDAGGIAHASDVINAPIGIVRKRTAGG